MAAPQEIKQSCTEAGGGILHTVFQQVEAIEGKNKFTRKTRERM
jgi:hypothetical protein